MTTARKTPNVGLYVLQDIDPSISWPKEWTKNLLSADLQEPVTLICPFSQISQEAIFFRSVKSGYAWITMLWNMQEKRCGSFRWKKSWKLRKMPFSGVMCARGIASSTFQIPAVYCHFHGDASPSTTCRKSIGADSFWSAGNVFEGLKHKILPVDRLIANLSEHTTRYLILK
jgi:hypothetical protein